MHYVFGNVNGHLTALQAALAQVQPGPGDTLIFTGDLINYGPDSVAVLELIWNLERITGAVVIPIRGDHEEVVLQALQTPFTPVEDDLPYFHRSQDFHWWEIWRQLGGQDTIERFSNMEPDRLRTLIQFVAGMPLYHELRVDGDLYLVSHAGLNPVAGNLKHQRHSDLLWTRGWEGAYLDRLQLMDDSPWERVIYSHTVTPESGKVNGPLVNLASRSGIYWYNLESQEIHHAAY